MSRLPGLYVDRLIEALSEEPFHIFLSGHYDLQTIQRALPFLCCKIRISFIFINHGFCQPYYSLTIWPKISRAFCFCASCRSDRVLSMLFNSCLDALAHSVTEVVGFSFLSSNVLKNLANCCCHFVRKKPELDLVDSNSVRNHLSDYQTRTNACSPICQL